MSKKQIFLFEIGFKEGFISLYLLYSHHNVVNKIIGL